uniref:Copper transporter n=1 Tax=Amorphochlora amoebiformis TaxID=1561963 RepID=A0A7S0DH84_9EUKA|mmetsp:Transcript_27295/g.43322  ORF Transcript_27295/g.43322 Transcript_27295/m.43322 type:complete len:531 (+) Transcript_27295:24-1616(+)
MATKVVCLLIVRGALASVLLVPSVDISRIFAAETQTSFRNALIQQGMLEISGVRGLEALQLEAMSALMSCELRNPELFTLAILEDGTRRNTVASQTIRGVSEPFEEKLNQACPKFSIASQKFRRLITLVGDAFITAFDSAFSVHVDRDKICDDDDDPTCAQYSSFTEALSTARQLDHFHVYSAPFARERDYSIEFHSDDGLFIAIPPPVIISSQGLSTSASRDFRGFEVKLDSGEIREIKTRSKNSVVFVLGAGMDRWIQFTGKHPRPGGVLHAVKVPLGVTRMWFGRMFLPPDDAFGVDVDIPFREYRKRVEQGDLHPTVACGAPQQLVHNARLDSKCGEGGYRCWRKCYYMDVNVTCGEDSQLECVSQSSGKSCDPEQHGCKPICSGVSTGSFCNKDISVTMYMEGFVSPGDSKEACIIFLFGGWTLDSKWKFSLACLGTVALGMVLEVLILFRRRIRDPQNKWRRSRFLFVSLEMLSYGTQVLLGYLLMLVAMTYSSPLFGCVIAGLVIGHIAFNLEGLCQQLSTLS